MAGFKKVDVLKFMLDVLPGLRSKYSINEFHQNVYRISGNQKYIIYAVTSQYFYFGDDITPHKFCVQDVSPIISDYLG